MLCILMITTTHPNFNNAEVFLNTRIEGKKINKNLGTLNPARKHYQIYFSGSSANNNMTFSKQGIFKLLRGYYHFKSYDYKGKQHIW